MSETPSCPFCVIKGMHTSSLYVCVVLIIGVCPCGYPMELSTWLGPLVLLGTSW